MPANVGMTLFFERANMSGLSLDFVGDIVVALIVCILSMGGFWLLFAKDLVSRQEVSVMIANNMLTKEDILQITESRNAIIEAQFLHFKEFVQNVQEYIKESTRTMNTLDKRMAVIETKISLNSNG